MKSEKIKFCIGRIFSFTDLNQGTSFFIPSVFKKIMSKKIKKFTLQNSNSSRDFIHVEEIVKSISLLYKKNSRGIFNICSGKYYTLKEIVLKIKKLCKSNKKIIFLKSSKKNIIGNVNKLQNQINKKPKSNIDKVLKKYWENKYYK